VKSVHVDFRKWGDRPHWQTGGTLLGEDEFGVWLGGAANSVAYSGPRGSGVFEPAFVQLFPRDEWWVAIWNATGGMELYVDVTTPPQWVSDDHVTMIDLDLDVIRFREDGRVILDDEDEFAEHQIEFGYPEDVVRRAQSSAEFLLEAVRSGAEPFGSASARWFQRLPD
jgi:protein associated with RNAse G/E